MTVKNYNKTGTPKQRGLKTSWQTHSEIQVNRKPANDTRLSSPHKLSFGDVIPTTYNSLATNKLLARKRRRSRHPLRDLRLQRGFTLEELANLTTLSPSYLSRLESGSRRLNADILQRLASVLSCHPGDLLTSDAHVNKYKSVIHLAEQAPLEHAQGFAPPRLSAPDLPLYKLKLLNDKAWGIDFDSPAEWISRPQELVGISGALSFSLQASTEHTLPRYRAGDYIFAHPTRPLSQNCSVLLVTHDNCAYLGDFVGWHSQKDPNDSIRLRLYTPTKTLSTENILNIDNNSIKALYRIIGSIESS
jgi:transcriptional regulator with XRE-family HTH domain